MSSVGTMRGGVIVGAILALFGSVLLAGTIAGVNLWLFTWPYFIIAPGLLCLAGVFQRGQAAAPLAMFGSMVTTTGLLLFYQNLLGDFRSWAYCWALVFPTAVGIGLLIHGRVNRHGRSSYYGPRFIAAGLTLCLVLAVAFETGVFTNGALIKFGGPVLLIVLGLLLSVGYLVRLSGQSAVERQ
jgi:hypothetical protein